MGRKSRDSKGFTLIEIAIVMIILGILTGAGASLIKILTQQRSRTDTLEYLILAKQSLLSYADNNGRLPWADSNGDGYENSTVTAGTIPYLDLKIRPADSHRRALRYEMNTNLGTDLSTGCAALKAGLAGNPLVMDADGAATSFPVAAVLVSAGPMDADSDGIVFDDLVAGGSIVHSGDNTDGRPNYIRYPPGDTFDDLIVYIGEYELKNDLCEYLILAVNNNSAATVYVYNQTLGSDIGALAATSSAQYDILSGTQVELRTAANGGGSILTSTPTNPITLSGSGQTLITPPPS